MIHNHISPIAFFHCSWSIMHTKGQRSHRTLNLISKPLKQECNAEALIYLCFFKACVVKKCMGRDDAHPARVGDQKLVLNLRIPFKQK